MPTIKVIIDTDPGTDDIVAILLALASPELEILAFIVSYGNTDRDSSYLNVFKAYQAIARHIEANPSDASRFPNFKQARPPALIRGANGPLEGELHSAVYFHGRDGLGGISERHSDLDVDPTSFNQQHGCLDPSLEGEEALLGILRSYPPRTVTYVALGPLTSLANLMRRDSQTIVDRIGRVICMGGALDVPGNTSPSAEFNFFADPFAVKLLLADPQGPHLLPLDRFLLLPLDITTPHEIPFPLYKEVVDPTFHSTQQPSQSRTKSPLTHFTSSFLERTRELMLEFGNDAMELHDIVAIWCAINNPPIQTDIIASTCPLSDGWKARKRLFDVERYGELTRGMLVVDRRIDLSAYSPGANRAEVQKISEALHQNDGLWESVAVPAQVEIESPAAEKHRPHDGVWCVTHTPGPKKLLELIFKRIWGVELTEESSPNVMFNYV